MLAVVPPYLLDNLLRALSFFLGELVACTRARARVCVPSDDDSVPRGGRGRGATRHGKSSSKRDMRITEEGNRKVQRQHNGLKYRCDARGQPKEPKGVLLTV